jgi:hypothetical protein
MSFTTRTGGLAAIAGALLAIGGNIAVLAAEPAVAEDSVSYPLSTGAYAGGQVFLRSPKL